jgi:hypothetical protein
MSDYVMLLIHNPNKDGRFISLCPRVLLEHAGGLGEEKRC